VTTARRAVLGALLAHEGHATAEDLAEAVQADHPEVHLSTVYRTLDAFEQLGLVAHVHLGHGRATYHLADDLHHHAVCDRCGAVLQLPLEMFEDVAARLRAEHGFVAEPHHFAVVGRCRECAATTRT
jgi:Fe2+ or Zn2+ uptake regulation protein